jgi:hypothetical protein
MLNHITTECRTTVPELLKKQNLELSKEKAVRDYYKWSAKEKAKDVAS